MVDRTYESNFIDRWIATLEEAARMRGVLFGMAKAKQLSTDELKALWDSYDGAETSDPDISGEAVHLEMNLRGEGSYVAV